MAKKKIRLVLVGGGHANTQVLKLLQGAKLPKEVEPILVSDDQLSLYSGMSPGGVTEQYKEAEFSVDLPRCARAWGWQFICKKLVSIKPGENSLVTSDGTYISYDILVLNLGSTNVGYDRCEGAARYSVSTRPLKQLIKKVNQAEKDLFKKLKQKAQAQTGAKPLNVDLVTVGSGCAGCELTMGLAERLGRSIRRYVTDHRLQLIWELRATIISRSSKVLAKDPPALRRAVLKTLQEKKVDLLTEHRVTKITPKKVYAVHEGATKSIEYDILLWATGAASHAIKSHDIARDEYGWFEVNQYLQSISHPNIFGAGDCVSMVNYKGMNYPSKAGVYAVRQGPILAQNIQAYLRHLRSGAPPNFRAYLPQTDFLRLLNTGDGQAIGARFGFSLKGACVWKLKDWIDRRWMSQFDFPSSDD